MSLELNLDMARTMIDVKRLRATGISLSSVFFLSGCAFYEAEFDECFDLETCEGQAGFSDLHSGEPGIGGGPTTGGTHSGGGSQAVGGSVAGSDTGGASTGGVSGVGGNVSTGGNVGTGGNPAGGSNGTGGDSGDEAVFTRLQASLSINEINLGSASFVEIYNVGAPELSLRNVYVAVNPGGIAEACHLDGLAISSGGFAVAQKLSTGCLDDSNCVQDCSFIIGDDVPVMLYYKSPSTLEWRLLDSVQTQPEDRRPLIGNSFSAIPDGSDSFRENAITVGAPNEG